ncbi:hypothetical protein P691DRAFT_756901 [Macrolepiota fuliginosa MF-IS2]|uniref:NACHT domain-containing protein n=1 Tax=Macrolepiota fuliginosa MF-IS2 TaxID=1400762 RepID=A0A9P5XI89_9AGAR|nr:hypothetical protein P691DRAFT_756901 [Macrolepiota fuliginosa MF-IS2]
MYKACHAAKIFRLVNPIQIVQLVIITRSRLHRRVIRLYFQDQHKRKLSSDGAEGGPSKRAQTVVDGQDHAPEDGTSLAPPTSSGLVEHTRPHLQNVNAESGTPSGFFHNSSNMVFQNSYMVQGTQNIYVNEKSTEALPWLQEHVIPGVEFDSFERDPPPRCQPGTRICFMQKFHDWLNNPKREKNVLWVRGPAGVGKSAIVQTLVESLAEEDQFGAGIFFSRLNSRTNPNQVFPSLAYQLAVRNPSYRSYIRSLMVSNPRSLSKAFNEQFRILFTEPFDRQQIRVDSGTWVIALDGLDECEGSDRNFQHPGRHNNDFQSEIAQVIIKFALKYPSVPLVWIISSRPEPHLEAVFSRDDLRTGIWEEDVAVDSDEARRDVEHFLRDKFDTIRQQHPEFITTPKWPNSRSFQQIAHAASGLFAFAAVVIRFIDDPSARNPVEQMNRVLTFLSIASHLPGEQHPLSLLDAIYTQIFRKITPVMLGVTKRLLATALFYNDKNAPHYDLITTCNLLGIARNKAVDALRYLRPVIRVPRQGKDLDRSHLRCYHTSFRNYLEDSSRSGNYHIDIPTTGADLFWASFRIMQALGSLVSRENPPNFHGIPLLWPTEDNPVGLKRLKGQLVEHALEAWECVLNAEYSSSGLTLKYHSITIDISGDKFQEFLESISIKKMVNVSPGVRRLLGSFHWNSRPEVPKEFMKRKFLSSTTLGCLSLGENLNSGSTKVMVDTHLNYIRICLNEKPSETNDETSAIHQYSIGALLRTVQSAPDTPITILGCNLGRCAIFRVRDDVGFGFVIYFITGFD